MLLFLYRRAAHENYAVYQKLKNLNVFYFSSETMTSSEVEVRLATAKGEVWPIQPHLEDYLPFPKDRMNFVVAYDPNERIIKRIGEAFTKIYPDYSFRLPEIDSSYETIPARAGGGRYAVIDKKHFEKKVAFGDMEIDGIKVKGCHVLGLPPHPIPYAPEPFKDVRFAPETFPIYDENGVESVGFKNQACGVLVRDATHELLMNLAAILFKVPINEIGICGSSYGGVFYPGNYDFSSERKLMQMGTAMFALVGDDRSVSKLALNIEGDPNNASGKLNISLNQAQTILNNFQELSNELDFDFETLFGEKIYRGAGKILDTMHTSGMIHGPRQSHYMNYTVPDKRYKELKVRDFENAILVANMTDPQALRYMGDDLLSLACSATRLYCILIECAAKVNENGHKPNSCDVGSLEKMLEKIDPLDCLLRGYTNGELDGDGAIKKYGKGCVPGKIVEGMRKEQLAGMRERWHELGKEVVAEKTVIVE